MIGRSAAVTLSSADRADIATVRSLHNDMLAGAAQQFFCEPATDATDPDECVYRDDTLVVLEMTTRDMMEVSPGCQRVTLPRWRSTQLARQGAWT